MFLPPSANAAGVECSERFLISCKVHSEPFHGYCRQIRRRVQVSHLGVLEAVTLQMNVKMEKKREEEINLCAPSWKCLSPSNCLECSVGFNILQCTGLVKFS